MTETYYTFVYCKMHDDGWVIQGNHSYVPDGYNASQHAVNACESCDWHTMGVVKAGCANNGCPARFEVVEDLRVNYDRYGGGYKFSMYTSTLTDDCGSPIENNELDTWIKTINKEYESSPDKKQIFISPAN